MCSRPAEQPEPDEDPSGEPLPDLSRQISDTFQDNETARSQNTSCRLRTSLHASLVTTGTIIAPIPRNTEPEPVRALEEAPASADDCPICMCTLTQKCVRTPCGHHFHEGCLQRYFRTVKKEREKGYGVKCPMCRSSMHCFIVTTPGSLPLCPIRTTLPT